MLIAPGPRFQGASRALVGNANEFDVNSDRVVAGDDRDVVREIAIALDRDSVLAEGKRTPRAET